MSCPSPRPGRASSSRLLRAVAGWVLGTFTDRDPTAAWATRSGFDNPHGEKKVVFLKMKWRLMVSVCSCLSSFTGHRLLRRGWVLPCAPSRQVFIHMGDNPLGSPVPSPLSRCQLDLLQHAHISRTGGPASPCASPVQRGGLRAAGDALPAVPRRPVAALPEAAALAPGQLGACQVSGEGQGPACRCCRPWVPRLGGRRVASLRLPRLALGGRS